VTALTPLQRIPAHAVRRDLLPADEHEALLGWVLAHEDLMQPSRIGTGETAPDIRRSLSVQKDKHGPWKAPMMARIGALVPELIAELGMQPLPVHKIEADMVAYRDGGFVRPHIDTAAYVRQPGDRMLTMVYYFHREPKGFGGGALRIHPPSAPPADAPQHVDLVPENNSLIAFAAWAPHEVLPVSVPSGRYEDCRFAINFWARRAPLDGQD
jgi:SM-20-related protein